MLRLAEELLLLSHNDAHGGLAPGLSPSLLNVALAGSVLMDLALEDRIDTDLERLVLLDATPLGESLLDPTLAEIARDREGRDTVYWIARTSERGDEIRSAVLGRLVARGILEAESDSRFFLSRQVSRTRRYLATDGKPQEDVRLRIMRVLFSDDIPDPRDVVIICLADACGVFENILSSAELAEAQSRIDLVRQLDAIGRSMFQAVRDLRAKTHTEARPAAKEIPQAKGLPIVGNALSMGGDMRGFLLQQFRELGPIFRLRAFRHRIIILAGPEANVFAAHDDRCLRSNDIWQDFHTAMGARHSPLSADGAVHSRMRRDHAQVYSRKLLVQDDAIADATRIVRREIAGWPVGEPLGAQYAFQRIITEQIGYLATGLSAQEYIDDIIRYSSTILSTQVSRHVPKLVLRMPRFQRARQRVRELVEKIVEAHDPGRRKDARRDFVDDLLELNRGDPHYIAEADFLLFLLGPFIAGLDTAASACAFMTYELAKHPEVREIARAEAEALFANGSPTLSDLRELDIIHRVAMEAMRLYPISPVLPRTAANSFQFQGHSVQAGQTVLIAHTVPHMMPEFYPDPLRFDIGRYLPGRAEHRRVGVYAPFGLGTHQCLGRSLAEVLMAINMACVLRETDIELHPAGYNLKTVPLPALRPHRSLRFRVVRRRKDA